jgi:hypothetical protein
MEIIIQYRYKEGNSSIGEGEVETSDPLHPALIPAVGDTFPLYPPTEGYARVVGVEEEVETGTEIEKRVVTVTIERI